MKKYILIFIATIISLYSISQAKKPTIMIVPSDNWCILNGYFDELDNQGTKVKIPNYKKALQESSDLGNVISKINGLMADRGFPLKNLETVIKNLESESAEDAMTTSKAGAGLSENSVEKLKRVAKADIIMQLGWTVESNGPRKSITFNLQGLDAYTSKQVATAGGPGPANAAASVIELLTQAVSANLDNFNTSLQKHFDDMFLHGREIVIKIKKFNSWEGDLEKEYGGKELGAIIEDWLKLNTKDGRFNTSDASANVMVFEQVRIPLYDENGKAIDARDFCKKLQKYLKETPYSITSKLSIKGLGQVTITLGDK